jgi:hypothetical protein
VVLTEAVTPTWFRPWEEWINVALGAWLAVSPWVLGTTIPAAVINSVTVGALIAGLALYEVCGVTIRKSLPRQRISR